MNAAGVAVRPTMRASKYSMTSVKRLKMERWASSKTMRSKKPGENCSIADAHRLLRGDVEALVGIDVGRADADARLVGQVRLEAVVERLLDERVAVGEEQAPFAPTSFEDRMSIRPMVVRVLPVPVAMTSSARRLPASKASATRRIASCW